jgi:hypothetical protein
MSEKYFKKGAASEPYSHPRIRAWRSWKSKPQLARIRVEVRRERSGLSVSPAKLFVEFLDGDGANLHLDEVLWERELDTWLIREAKALAVDTENEKLRFSLFLRFDLAKPLRIYGDGFFNTVLMEIADRDFGYSTEIKRVTKAVHRNSVQHGSSRDDCVSLIEHALGDTAGLIDLLYPSEGQMKTAQAILSGALAQYIDDRFHVTERELLGFH